MTPETIREMAIADLRTEAPFDRLFPTDPDVLARIIASMHERGFDPAQPIVIWGDRVIDGHTRQRAARDLGLATVWVVARDFADEDEAVLAAIAAQVGRRNL